MSTKNASLLDQLEISDAKIEEVIEPFVSRVFTPDATEWRKLYNRTSIIRAVQRYRRQVSRLLGLESRRTDHQAEGYGERYTVKWREDTLHHRLALKPGQTPCAWKGRGFRLNSIAIKRVHQLYLMNILAAVRPDTVLEIGCGVGLNLLTMAARFPDIGFSGVELSGDAVTTGKALIQQPRLPEPIQSRVEDWRASLRVRWLFRRFRSGPQSGSHGHVSSPRSSNRTCGFPASGFRTRSCLRARKAQCVPRQTGEAVFFV